MSRLSGVFMALALVVAVGAGVLLAQGGGRAVAVVFVAAIAAFVAIPAWHLFKDRDKSWIGRRLKLSRTDARDLGSFLLTGVVLAIAVGLLQITLDIAREREARDEQFRLSVGVSQNLAGLDARGESLSGLSLSGKNLERADLQDADLSDTNLESALLRDADLRGADLEDASLYAADLSGASLRGADLSGADLRFARMPDAGIYALDDYDQAELDGALVNGRTCFPPDIITGRDEAEKELRDEIVEMPTEVHGRAPEPALPPYQCPFTFDNLIDHLRQHKSGRTYLELAKPWREKAKKIAKIFEKPGRDPPEAAQLALQRPVCIGSKEVAVQRREQWAANGAFALIVGQPGKRRRNTQVVPLSVEEGAPLRPVIVLERPVKRNSEVMLFATPSTNPGAPNSALRQQVAVRRC